jgi:hypothetical protein
VARNRAGGREPIVLSEREVFASPRTDDRSAATLWLSWRPAAGSAREVRVSRTLPREGFAVLELDGAAFRGLTFEREAEREGASRLVVVDADADADVLARRYPDGRTHLITAATLRFVPGRPPDADAVIGISPQRIHVPREWAAELPRPDRETGRASRPFEVELRYGSNYEPWVTRISARSARSTPEALPIQAPSIR